MGVRSSCGLVCLECFCPLVASLPLFFINGRIKEIGWGKGSWGLFCLDGFWLLVASPPLFINGRRVYIGVCRRGACVIDLWRRSYSGVCRGSVSVNDLWRRSYIGIVMSECPTRASSKSVLQECRVRVSSRVSSKSVK